MHDHAAAAVGAPDLIALDEGVVCLRFETMKVVSALAAVEHLLDRGLVRPGDTLVDSSSGVYAHALALACHRFGMKCHIVGSTTVDPTLRTQLAILGATLEQMAPSTSLKHDQNRRVRRIREILDEHPDYHWMRQYHDDVHHLGYRPIADLLAAELGDGITLVGGVGSGVSTGALATYLRRTAPDTTLVGVQPFGSITFGSQHVHDPEIIIAGIGSSIVFDNVSHQLYDTIHWTSFDTAMSGTIDLLRRHALFAGLSSGAAYACARWERSLAPTRTVVFIAPDTGHRYAESVFARHERAAPLESLAPAQVCTTEELALPWCRMDWKRAPALDDHR